MTEWLKIMMDEIARRRAAREAARAEDAQRFRERREPDAGTADAPRRGQGDRDA